jgi:hypothetical protein
MVTNDTCSRLHFRCAFRCGAAVLILALALSPIESAQAQGRQINMGVTVWPDVTTVLYFDAGDNLLWVEKFEAVKSRAIVPIEDKALMAKIPFAAVPKPAKHYDCTTCPEKKADLVTSGVASKAVYCGREDVAGKAMAAPLIVEDLTSVSGRLIALAATTDPSPCPFPKKCHCGGATCCCW